MTTQSKPFDVAALFGAYEKKIDKLLAPLHATFKSLPIGATFDFISGTHHDSFFERCKKISPRKYSYHWQSKDAVATIGSVHARVYHVENVEVQS